MFITFEGIEGSGKTTQIKLLADHLKGQGYDVVSTREPGGTEIGNDIRKILLDAQNKHMAHACEVLLYYAARAQHLKELIVPSLEAGKVVLCDRFVEATMAYQGYARGVDAVVLENLNQYVLAGVKAKACLLFDLPVEVGLGRAKARADQLEVDQREDRFENEQLEFHQKVRDGYLALAKKEPDRFCIIDASLNVEDLHQEVLRIISEKMKK
jgi:dTMP kinase